MPTIPHHKPGAYDPRPSSRANTRAQKERNWSSKIFAGPAPPKIKPSSIPGELTAGAVSRKTPAWFQMNGVPVRPLSPRALRKEPPTKNGRNIDIPKSQMQIQKEQMVGTSVDNPPFMRIPYNRATQVFTKADTGTKTGADEKPQVSVHSQDPPSGNARIHLTRYYEQAAPAHTRPPTTKDVIEAMKQPSRISTESPAWMHIPQVPIVYDEWKDKDRGIKVRPPAPPNGHQKISKPHERCVSEAAPTWMHIPGLPQKPYRKPEPLSVKSSFENAASREFNQIHPVNFHYRRAPGEQEVVQDHKYDLSGCGNYHGKVAHHTAVSAKAPDNFHIDGVHKAHLTEYHHQKGAHMRNMRPTLDGNVHQPKRKWRTTTSSQSYNAPDWMKIRDIHIVNGPAENLKMVAGANNNVLIHNSDVDKVAALFEREKQSKKLQKQSAEHLKKHPTHQFLNNARGERHGGAPSEVPRARVGKQSAAEAKAAERKFTDRKPSKSPVATAHQLPRSTGTANTATRPPSRATVKNGKPSRPTLQQPKTVDMAPRPSSRAAATSESDVRLAARVVGSKPERPKTTTGQSKDRTIQRLREELNSLLQKKAGRATQKAAAAAAKVNEAKTVISATTSKAPSFGATAKPTSSISDKVSAGAVPAGQLAKYQKQMVLV